MAQNLQDLGLGELLADNELEVINGQQRLKNPFEIRAIGLNFDREGSFRQLLRDSGFISDVNGVERIMGIAVGDEESASFLEYGRPGQRLTENQIAALKSLINNEILQGNTIIDTITNPESMAEKIAKLTKRHKSFSSPRQVSMAGRGLGDFLGVPSDQPFIQGAFRDTIHLFQPQAELFAARFGIDQALVSSVIQGPRFYQGADLMGESQSLIDYAMGQITPTEEADIRNLVQTAFANVSADSANTTKEGVIDEFKSLVKNSTLPDELKNRVQNSLKQTEISVDGEFVINRVNLERSMMGWTKTVNNVENDMRVGGVDSISTERYQDYLDAKAMLDTVAERTGSAKRAGGGMDDVYALRDDIDQIGFSGRVMYFDPRSGEKRFIKGRMRVRDLGPKISIATPDIMIKSEAGMEEFINFDIVSGTGGKTAARAPDIQTLLFHSDEFFDTVGGERTLPQVTLSYGQELTDELQQLQMSGIIPGKVKQRMMQDLRESGTAKFMRTFEPHKVSSKEKNREMVRRLNDAILTGNLTDPEVIGAISNYYRNEMFDQKSTRTLTDTGRKASRMLRIPKTPDYMAFDVSSEMSALQFEDSPRLLSGRRRFPRHT